MHRTIAYSCVVGAFALLLVAVPLAWASHLFTDVPDANPFHDDISAVKGAGITGGKTCEPPGTPPTYCPTEPITREAMAAFVHRGLGRAGTNAAVPTELSASDYLFLAPVTITTGGVPGGKQFVLLRSQVSVRPKPGSVGCPCKVLFEYRNSNEAGGIPIGTSVPVTVSNVGSPGARGAMTWAVGVPTATTITFSVGARQILGSVPVDVTAVTTAVIVPFGASGGSTLGATGAPGG